MKADRMILLLVLSTACAERPSADQAHRCLDLATRRATSPSLLRTASANTSRCGGVLAPQVAVEFKTPEGTGGPGVFAVSDSAADIGVRWRAEDTLEISYPASANVIKQDTIARFFSQHVRVVYVTTGAPTK